MTDACCDDADDEDAKVEPSRGAAPSGPLRRVALGVAYDGGSFHGFAAQPGQCTVSGSISAALGKIFGAEPHLVCAGRTDAGVHARTQVVHADLPLDVLERRYGAPEGSYELEGLVKSLSHQLGPEIGVYRAELAPAGFDARHSAIWRRYRYDIDCSGRPDPVRAASIWAIEEHLDLAAMRLGAYPLIGEHDFAAFCRQRDGEEGPIMRRVLEVGFVEGNDGVIHFEISATAFCHQMVRSIVGMLAAIGRGKARAPDVVSMLRSGSRQGAPTIAPAKGLTLIAVGYPDELGGAWR
ncbi:MAG TPA: tRNA pseudouridine(38-40) synthase TruA [Acidimicrobiales bacterium]